MKKILGLLRYKEVYVPLSIFIAGLLMAYFSRRFLTGTMSNALVIFGCLTTMSATDSLAKAIGHFRSAEKEQKSQKKK